VNRSTEIGQFLDFLYGTREGHALLCVGTEPRMEEGKLKHEDFVPVAFQWPGGRRALVDAIEDKAPTCDVYVTVNLFKRPRRTAENALPTDLLWADDVPLQREPPAAPRESPSRVVRGGRRPCSEASTAPRAAHPRDWASRSG
jgi:hypothetical protein